MQNVILISVMAGVFGTGFGGLLGMFFGKQSLNSSILAYGKNNRKIACGIHSS